MAIILKDREEAKAYIKGELEHYLQQTGRPLHKNFKCPNTAYHRHGDNNPSMSYDRKRGVCRCHTESSDFDTLDLIKADYNLTSWEDVFKKAYELFDIRLENQKQARSEHMDRHTDTYTHTHTYKLDLTGVVEAAHKALLENEEAQQHLLDRGISHWLWKEYKLGYAEGGYNALLKDYPQHHSKSRKQDLYKYVFPCIDAEGKCSYFITEICDRTQLDEYSPKYRKISRGDTELEAELFNERYITGDCPETVFICEGVYDALSIEAVGGKAIALTGTGTNRLIQLCKANTPPAHFVICMDNDDAGQHTTVKLEQAFTELGLEYSISTTPAGKDVNEALLEDLDSFVEYVDSIEEEIRVEHKAAEEAERQEYLKTSVAYELKDFIADIKGSAGVEAIPTKFVGLDNLLDGGLFEGLYFIGAISSLGKTTFCLQLLDQLAQQGVDTLFFSLETSKQELMAKSISRHTALESIAQYKNTKYAKSTRGILTGKRYKNYLPEDLQIIQDAVKAYAEYAKDHIFIHQSIGEIGTAEIEREIQRHIKATGKAPVVVIDYLQILKAPRERLTDKEKVDLNVTALKLLAVNYHIPIIGISSFNRENYTSPVSMASFKESGAVEYSSDVLMGLQYEGMDYREEETSAKREKRIRELIKEQEDAGRQGDCQRMQLKILKNRNGVKGSAYFDFYPEFNLFLDVGKRAHGIDVEGWEPL